MGRWAPDGTAQWRRPIGHPRRLPASKHARFPARGIGRRGPPRPPWTEACGRSDRELVSIHDVQPCYNLSHLSRDIRLRFPGARLLVGAGRSAVVCRRRRLSDGNPGDNESGYLLDPRVPFRHVGQPGLGPQIRPQGNADGGCVSEGSPCGRPGETPPHPPSVTTHTQPTSRSQRNPLVRLRPPEGPGCAALRCTCGVKGSYLVDPASSHMLVSKIKPCMSKYKLLYTVKLRMAH